MFKKILATLMVFAFVNVHAAAPVNNLKVLSGAYNELNFALTVEWDQKDKKFHDAQIKKFKKVVVDLQKKGLDNKDLLKFAQKRVNNKKVAQELETLFNVVEINKLTDVEAREFLLSTVRNNSDQGSSWLGRSATPAFIGLLVVLVILLAASSGSGSGTYYDDGYYDNCYEDYVCYDTCDYYGCYTDCYWETTCY